ncbi:MAG: hypothetical protein AAF518_08220 [Spirochaetota bacterium]
MSFTRIWIILFACISLMEPKLLLSQEKQATEATDKEKKQNEDTTNTNDGKETNTTEKDQYPASVATGLKATLLSDKRSIKLEWNPPRESGEIIVARSQERIDTPAKLYISDSLGKYRSNPKDNPYISHKDINLKPGKYYYSIVLRHSVKKQNVKLIPGVNFIMQAVTVPDLQVKDEKHFIRQLKVEQTKKSLNFSWLPPNGVDLKSVRYTLYKSRHPLTTNVSFQRAKIVSSVQHPKNSYAVPADSLKNQFMYYGVTVSIKSFESRPLESPDTFVRVEKIQETARKKEKQPVKPNEEMATTQSHVKNLTYELNRGKVILLWNPPAKAVLKETVFHIYRFSEKPEEKPIAAGKGQKLQSLFHPETIFELDAAKITADTYLAVTVQDPQKAENQTLYAKDNFLLLRLEDLGKEASERKVEKESGSESTPPAEETSEKPVVPPETDELRQILRETYKQRNFVSAIDRLQTYVAKTTDPQKKAKGLFYMALSHYHQKDFRGALRILLKKEVQMNYNKERVDFYTKRCIEYREKKDNR